MSDETKVWTGWLYDHENGHWEASDKAEDDADIPVFCMRRPSHGFLPGDRVRTVTGMKGGVIGPTPCDNYLVVRYDGPSASNTEYGGWKPENLTRIDPEPPVERTYTEAEVRAALEDAWAMPAATDGILARLREGVSDE